MRTIPILLAVLVCFVPDVRAADTWLEGTILEVPKVGAAKTSVPGAFVAVQGYGLLTADDSGSFRLRMPVGLYTVTATAPGYELGTKICEVTADVEVSRCDLHLKRIAPLPAEPSTEPTGNDPDAEVDVEQGGCHLVQGEGDGAIPALLLVLSMLGIRCSSRRRS